MAEVNQSMAKIIYTHQPKIVVVKFDGTNNFSIWRFKVMDAQTALNLKDSLLFDKKPKEISEKN